MESMEDSPQIVDKQIEVHSPVIGNTVIVNEVPDAGEGWRQTKVDVEDKSGVAWFDPPA